MFTVRNDELLEIMKSELVLALGCTEPGTVAYAAAAAARPLDGEVSSVKLHVTPGIYKNGATTFIPSTGKRGLHIAAALGAIAATPEKELMVLENISDTQISKAESLIERSAVSVEPVEGAGKNGIYVEAWVRNNQGNTGHSVISGSHNNLVLVEKDDTVLKCSDITESAPADGTVLKRLRIDDILSFVESIDLQELFFINDSIRVNWEIAQYGIGSDNGLRVGRTLKKLEEGGILGRDVASYSYMMTTAAVDVRMGGIPLPAMACGGSGNQGILASVPIIAAARQLGIGEEKLLRALALSYLTTIYAKESLGKLSVLCGCSTAAGMGCAAGMTWLMGGDRKQIKGAIHNVLAGLSGMICDGAKEGCSFKIMSSVFAVVQSSLLALNGVFATPEDGIIGATEQDTIANLTNLSREGMSKADSVIIGILKEKLCEECVENEKRF